MVTRLLGVFVAASLTIVAGCATPTLDAQEAATAALDAFAAAGLDAAEPAGVTLEEVDLAVDEGVRTGEVWLMILEVDGLEWTVGVDPDTGSVVRTFEPVGSELSAEQVEALASHEYNPRAEHRSTRQRRVGVVSVVVVIAVAYLVARTLARRSLGHGPSVVVEPDD